MASDEVRSGPYLLPSLLPSDENISFFETKFFADGHQYLPTPAEVRLAAGKQENPIRPPPVVFPSLKLIVKYGYAIKISEVPEVYGWRTDEGQTFIYMENIDARTLETEWPGLDVEEKYEICVQLRFIIDELRQLRQDPSNTFIGRINQTPLGDVIFDSCRALTGYFSELPSFHDWFSGVKMPEPGSIDSDPWRPHLLDDASIVFTHADLHRSNILMSWNEDGTPKVAAIVDWHQSGWYPAPWEFYKTRWTARFQEQWDLIDILEFLQAYRGYIPWDYFVLKRGC